MRIYVYTQDTSGNRQVTMPADDATLELILESAAIFGHVVGDRNWKDGAVNRETGEQETIRLVTLTPAPLDMQGHIMVMSDVMEVSHLLKPGDRVSL